MNTLDPRQTETEGNSNGCTFGDVCLGNIHLLLSKAFQEAIRTDNSMIELGKGDFAFFEADGKKTFVAINMKNHLHHDGIMDYIKSTNHGIRIENVVLGNFEFDGKSITLAQRYTNAFGFDLSLIQNFLDVENLGITVDIAQIRRDSEERPN